MINQNVIRKAANLVTPDMMREFGIGWLCHVAYQTIGAHRNPAHNADYAPRKAFADWFAPADYRNDGLRMNETAAERGLRIGADATRAAMLEFAALPPTGQPYRWPSQ